MDSENIELPLDFEKALEKNPAARRYFYSLTAAHKREIIAHINSIHSKEELESFVEKIHQTMWL